MRHVQNLWGMDNHLVAAALRAEVKIVLNKVCELVEELFKSTVVTASMLSTAKSLLALENKEKLGYPSVLVTQLHNEYSSWIQGNSDI